MTKKQYYEDLYCREFDALVAGVREKDGKFHVALDQTAFYPEGGGQPCDLGTLSGVQVESVYEEAGEIYHVLAKAPAGEKVHGKIDWERRFDLMQQHLGQHILSAVCVNEFEANTINLRMERDSVSIDLDRCLGTHQVERAEMLANAAIYQNIPTEILYPGAEEIAEHSKRKIPKTEEAIRIVKIGDLDYSPCCGTHTAFTGEVGMIKVLGTDTQKTGCRIHFICGGAVLARFGQVWQEREQMQKELSCGGEELIARIRRLKEELQVLKLENQTFLEKAAEGEAENLGQKALHLGEHKVIAHVLEHTSQAAMKQIFAQLTEEKNTVVLLGGKTPNGAMLMFGSHKSEKKADVREAFKNSLDMIGGKGGGSAVFAQGMGSDNGALEESIRCALEKIKEQLQ